MKYLARKTVMDVVIFAGFISVALAGLGLSCVPRETDGFGYAALLEEVRRFPPTGLEIRHFLQRDGMITERDYAEISARHPGLSGICTADCRNPKDVGIEELFTPESQKKELLKLLGHL